MTVLKLNINCQCTLFATKRKCAYMVNRTSTTDVVIYMGVVPPRHVYERSTKFVHVKVHGGSFVGLVCTY